MTSTPSTILDPVTGLPLDQYSGIIQQIPLGSQVFPFEDLNADGRMTRQPIYGDDILPTSALVVGQDTKGMARAGTMDTSRRLWTREAVFQNLGQPIPDGTTAPVDVNVVSGGGGGGGSAWGYTTGYKTDSLVGSGLQPFDTIKPAPTKIYAFIGTAYAYDIVSTSGGFHDVFSIGYGAYTVGMTYPLFTDVMAMNSSVAQLIEGAARWNFTFPAGLPVLGSYSNVNPFTIWTECPTVNLYVMYTLLYA